MPFVCDNDGWGKWGCPARGTDRWGYPNCLYGIWTIDAPLSCDLASILKGLRSATPEQRRRIMAILYPCPDCRGKGYIWPPQAPKELCDMCHGKGYCEGV